jgi:hypothetical protein
MLEATEGGSVGDGLILMASPSWGGNKSKVK